MPEHRSYQQLQAMLKADAEAQPAIRPLSEIVDEIYADWRKVNYAAEPYLSAMREMDTVNTPYGLDSGRSIVQYFLANATSWRGETARRVKAELKGMIK